jgi:hypothetical protein
MKKQSVTQRISWRLHDLARACGLSVSFLRSEIRAGRLPSKRAGAAVLVLDEDFKHYLEGSRAPEQKVRDSEK